MRLYVPDIGDLLRLTQHWSFTLLKEYRNMDVWDALECDNHPSLADHAQKVAELELKMREIEDRMVPSPLSRQAHGITKEYASVQDRELWFEYRNEVWQSQHKITCPMTLPADTVLKVDRVYIRQGAGEYSSLSFYIEETPHAALTPLKKGGGFKKGRRRFFARLSDVNTMEVQRVDSAHQA